MYYFLLYYLGQSVEVGRVGSVVQGACFLGYLNSETDGVTLTPTELYDFFERL
jgi:hypothetical protein